MSRFEYLEENPATWKFQKLPDIPEWFERKLTALGGMNPHGAPNLRVVKGNEVWHDRAEQVRLKYPVGSTPVEIKAFEYRLNGETFRAATLEEIPPDAMISQTIMGCDELGKLRYVIERWTSPEELESQGRFQRRADENGQILLRDFPREGIYEEWFTVQTADHKFRELDAMVLEFCRYKWKFDQLPEDERVAAYEAWEAENEVRDQNAYEERIAAIMAGDERLPREEMERREEYWAKYHYTEERRRGLA